MISVREGLPNFPFRPMRGTTLRYWETNVVDVRSFAWNISCGDPDLGIRTFWGAR